MALVIHGMYVTVLGMIDAPSRKIKTHPQAESCPIYLLGKYRPIQNEGFGEAWVLAKGGGDSELPPAGAKDSVNTSFQGMPS